MKFCENCGNLYYMRESEKKTLIFYCRNCNNESQELTAEDICVSRIQVKKSNQSFHHIINKYTKLDPTLPRTNTVLCPNQDCETNKKSENGHAPVEREIIFIRYDETNIRYIYLCSTCDTSWKTASII